MVCLFLRPVVGLAAEPADTVLSYFQSIQAGDMAATKTYLGDAFYESHSLLLEGNPTYQRFIVNHYAGASFRIVSSAVNGNEAEVGVLITFSDGSANELKLVLKNESDNWKIVGEYH